MLAVNLGAVKSLWQNEHKWARRVVFGVFIKVYSSVTFITVCGVTPD